MKEKVELIMLGTGHATVTKCYNTCFALKTKQASLLIDAGGGNGILRQLDKAKISLQSLAGIFVTHVHTDHLLGVVWVIRMAAQAILSGQTERKFCIYSHNKVLWVLDLICRNTLSKEDTNLFGDRIVFRKIYHNECIDVGDLYLQFFDLASTKEIQFGFRATLPDNTTVVCLGDEPYKETLFPFVKNANWLLHEAFCLYKERNIYKPYEIHHSTALDAGRIAEELMVKKLLLYHTEDNNLDKRKYLYTQEAGQVFSGQIYVPDDLEKIIL